MKDILKGRSSLIVGALSLGMLGLLGLIPNGGEPMAGLSLIRLGLALLAILSLIRAAVPLLQGMGHKPGRKQARLRTESVLSLGGRQKVAIIVVDEREMLVGLGGDRVTLLTELQSDEEFRKDELVSSDFREQLERVARV
jgi:flagellar biogenesis protein FliO